MPRPRRAAARKSYADIEDGPEVETNDDLIEQPTGVRPLPATIPAHRPSSQASRRFPKITSRAFAIWDEQDDYHAKAFQNLY